MPGRWDHDVRQRDRLTFVRHVANIVVPCDLQRGLPRRREEIDEGLSLWQVITLVAKMEQLRGCQVHPEVRRGLELWLEALRGVQGARRDEVLHAAHRHRLGATRLQEDRGGCLSPPPKEPTVSVG